MESGQDFELSRKCFKPRKLSRRAGRKNGGQKNGGQKNGGQKNDGQKN